MAQEAGKTFQTCSLEMFFSDLFQSFPRLLQLKRLKHAHPSKRLACQMFLVSAAPVFKNTWEFAAVPSTETPEVVEGIFLVLRVSNG